MISEFVFFFTVTIFAIVFHEYAHGFVANRLGDPTAKEAGRLSLNPIVHIDLVGSILLPGALLILRLMGYSTIIFGWAKPVPVNFARLNNPRRDMMLVAIAGPLTNIIFAILFSVLYHAEALFSFREYTLWAMFINLALAVINLVPIPPLDGSRIMMGILPAPLAIAYARLESVGILIVFGLMYVGLFDKIIFPVIVWLIKLLGVGVS